MCLWYSYFPTTLLSPCSGNMISLGHALRGGRRRCHLGLAVASCRPPFGALTLVAALTLAFAPASVLLVARPRCFGLLWGGCSCRGYGHRLAAICPCDRRRWLAQEEDSLQVRWCVHVGGLAFVTSCCSLGSEAVVVGTPLVVLGLCPALSTIVVARVRWSVEAAAAPHDRLIPIRDGCAAPSGEVLLPPLGVGENLGASQGIDHLQWGSERALVLGGPEGLKELVMRHLVIVVERPALAHVLEWEHADWCEARRGGAGGVELAQGVLEPGPCTACVVGQGEVGGGVLGLRA